ncbi:MAG: hypothetical protein JST27_05680 [Bacteroidetes bacterium]|nr:hypothetical protein [Bacteroidota bacterium]
MTVTTNNYFDAILKINWASVPDSLKKTRDTLVPDASRNDWKIYQSDEDVRRVVDKYFGYIGKYATSSASKKKAASPKAASTETSVSESTKQEARAVAVALVRPYVERGETVEQLRKSHLGTSNGSGSAQIKGNKIIVDRVAEKKVNISFSLSSIFSEIKGGANAGAKQGKAKKAPKAKNISDLPEPKQVVTIPTSTAFIKRYVALHGKVKTRDQIVSLIHGLQKAITEQRIKTGNPALQEIEKMQSQLLSLATNMGESAKVEIDAVSLAHYKQIAQGEEVRTSVKLLKSFISMSGKAYDKTKAKALLGRMGKAIDAIPKEDPYLNQLRHAMKSLAEYDSGKDGAISIPAATLHGLGGIATGHGADGLGIVGGSGEGAVIRLLRDESVKNLSDATLRKAFRKTAVPGLCFEIAKSLIRRKELTMEVLNSPSSKKKFMGIAGIDGNETSATERLIDLDILEMRLSRSRNNSGGFSGLGSIAQIPVIPPTVPVIQTAPEIPTQSAVPVSARELAKMRFETIGYKGRFKDVVGDPAIGFHMMVYGKPFQGKSSFVIELCKDLIQLKKGRVAYLALEEGISASMQKKIIDRQAGNIDGLDFMGAMPGSFEGYTFVVIDSVSDRAIKRDKLRELFLHNPKICFICIFHATKEGSARGGLDYSHDMDIIIKIEGHQPFVEKNRYL